MDWFFAGRTRGHPLYQPKAADRLPQGALRRVTRGEWLGARVGQRQERRRPPHGALRRPGHLWTSREVGYPCYFAGTRRNSFSAFHPLYMSGRGV